MTRATQVPLTEADQNATFIAQWPTFEERAKAMLSRVYQGLHHVQSLRVLSPSQVTCLHYGDLSTYDWDRLTRLVLAAHEYCIRVSISQGGPRTVRITLTPRINRDGCPMSERHPTIHEAIERYNRRERSGV